MLVCNDDDSPKRRDPARPRLETKVHHKYIGGNFRLECPPGRPPAASSYRITPNTHESARPTPRFTHPRTFKDPRHHNRQSGGLGCDSEAPPAPPGQDQRIILPLRTAPQRTHLEPDHNPVPNGRRNALEECLAVEQKNLLGGLLSADHGQSGVLLGNAGRFSSWLYDVAGTSCKKPSASPSTLS